MTVAHYPPLVAIRMCETCGQPLRTQRGGVFLSPLKAAIFDAVTMAGDYGVTVHDLMQLDVWRDRKPIKPVTIRAHIMQINDALASTQWRIGTIYRRYVLMVIPAKGCRP